MGESTNGMHLLFLAPDPAPPALKVPVNHRVAYSGPARGLIYPCARHLRKTHPHVATP